MNQQLEQYLAHRAAQLARVRAVLIEDLKVARTPEDLDPDAPLFGTGLSLDSVDAVELIVAIETQFGFRIDDDAATRPALRTINTLVDLVLRKQGVSYVAP